MKENNWTLQCLLIFSLIPYSYQFVCPTTVPPTGASKGPSLPHILERFTSNIEINIVDKNLSIDAIWYFDSYKNVVALKTTKFGINTKAIYNYPTNEVFIITEDNVCTVSNLTSRPETALFGIDSSDGYYHVMSSNYALKFGKQFNEVYIGPDTVRGINVDHWRSCLYWPQGKANFTVDYYFSSQSSWNTSSASISSPVRADVSGIQQNSDGSTSNFHHVYDFFAFRLGIEDGSVFQTGPGIICPGRVNTQKIPSLPKQFYYRQEIAVPEVGLVTYADVWYDESYRLIRIDYRPITSRPPTWNVNPVTEIQDYSSGVRYLKDRIRGNCTVLPITNTSFGAFENSTVYKTENGSYVVQMKNPLQLFYIDSGFTYVGKRQCRSLQCDVYSAIRDDFTIEGLQQQNVNTTIEIYFLSDYMTNYPNDGTIQTKNIPVKIIVSSDLVGFSSTYNFMDFNEDHPDLSRFDISSCYSESAKLYFKVRFPGLFKRDTIDAFKLTGRLKIAQLMGVSPLRIQNVHLDIDFVNIFLHATLLDRSPATAQFTYIGGMRIEKQDDMIITQVLQPMQCADLCVDEQKFTCNSFDFCVYNGVTSCRLSKQHVGDGKTVLINSTCDHFSRTLNGPRVPELSVYEAYSIFRKAVYHQKLLISILETNQELTTYVGTETSIDFGTYKPIAMPSFTGQFSYNQEITIPGLGQIFASRVWYDTGYKLVRYDYTDSKPLPPFYSTNPMTVIHDFNSGLAYNIDQFYQNCTITQINAGTFDADLSGQVKTNGYIIQMKSPLEVFHITNNYKFMGQKTVREMLCNVFETVLKDFTMPGLNGTYTALVQYFFLAQDWFEVGNRESQLTTKQIIRQEFSILEKGLFFVYNYFDFEERHPDLSIFDVRNCFDANQQTNFQVKFQGNFHPYLDIYQKVFLGEAQAQMALISGVASLRYQTLQLSYDEDSIYLTGTLLGQAPYINYFTNIPGRVLPHKSDRVFVNTSSAAGCATTCFTLKSFQCNSFDFCPSVGYCFMSKLHTQDGAIFSNQSICNHYSRTVSDNLSPEPGLWSAYNQLKNKIYSGGFQVKIPHINTTISYPAVSVSTTDLQPGSTIQGGLLLKHFKVMKKNVLLQNNDLVLEGIAVDDCAASCDHEELFDCQSFEYCFASGTCYLSKLHPDENTSLVQKHEHCDLYSREYLDRFTQLPGIVFKSAAFMVYNNVPTATLCARKCVTNSKCKSFDYCITGQSCRLLTTHRLTVNKTDMTQYPSCSHFDRKYIDDFRKNLKKDITFGVTRIVAGLSPELCAKLCVEELGLNCRSFVYCGNITSCKFVSVSPKQAPAGTLVDNPGCNLYTRSFYPPPMGPAGNQPITTKTPPTKQNPTGHVTSPQGHVIYPSEGPKVEYLVKYMTSDNTGPYIGIAFGVFFPGLVLGAALLYFYRKYKVKQEGDDTMRVQFVNSDD